MTQNIYPNTGALLKETWSLFKTNFFKLFKVMLIPMLVFLVTAIVFGIGGALFAFLLKGNSAILMIGIPLVFIFIIGMVIISLWSNVAIFYAVSNLDKELNIKDIYRLSWPLIGGFFMTSMIVGFIVLGGFTAFIIPGILIAIATSLTPFIAVNEKIYNLNAALKSRHYLMGHRWEYFCRIIVVVLIQFLIFIILGALDTNDSSILVSLIEFIFSVGFGIFYSIYAYLNYKYLSQMAPSKFDPKVARVKYTIFGFLSILSFIGIVLISITVSKSVNKIIKEGNINISAPQSKEEQAELDKLMKILKITITPIESPTE